MKRHNLISAMFAGAAAAQSSSVTTVTLSDCPPTMSMPPVVTVTSGVTLTLCDKCTHTTPPSVSTAPPPYTGPYYTTTKTVTFVDVCETGLVTSTYTVTESCTDPTWPATTGNYVPPGFIVTTKPCTACGPKTTVVTVTQPCPGGCDATSGVRVTATPTPPTPAPSGAKAPPGSGYPAPAPACTGDKCGNSNNGNASAAPAPGSGTPGPAPAPACTGDKCGSSNNGNSGSPPGGNISQISDGQVQAPTLPASCIGANCKPASAPTQPASYPPPSTSGVPQTPATAGASSVRLGVVSFVVVALSSGLLAVGL